MAKPLQKASMIHQAVLLTEAVAGLNVHPDEWYLDGTFGRGGHTREILNQGGNVLALDFDQEAIEAGQQAFSKEISDKRLILVRENFAKLYKVVTQAQEEGQIGPLMGVLFDFGTSADQLTNEERGFSFNGGEGVLDMRMDNRLGVTARDLLGVLPAKQLAELFVEYGGERFARPIANAIVAYRQEHGPISTTGQLVTLIMQNKKGPRGHLHPATQVFQALRIAVNDELTNIKQGLEEALRVVRPGGRVVTIAFHEGEDRIAKHFLLDWDRKQLGTVMTKKPIEPSAAELEENPRARSAKLRIFEKKL
jgi:16S rRNA (cytosine1402-N4)-methyltransferase